MDIFFRGIWSVSTTDTYNTETEFRKGKTKKKMACKYALYLDNYIHIYVYIYVIAFWMVTFMTLKVRAA